MLIMADKMKRCEICGEIKPLSEFSKSYKNRCKKCVAEETMFKRYGNTNKLLLVAPTINWEQRRYEIAKDIVANSFSTPMENVSMVSYIHNCVQVADMLIEELKRK